MSRLVQRRPVIWHGPELSATRRQDIMPIYEKPAWQLMRDDMVEALEIKKGDVFSREEVLTWFDKHYPDIKSSTVSQQLRRLSTNARSRVNHTIKPEDHDVFFQVDGSRFRLYDPENDPIPIYPDSKQSPVAEELIKATWIPDDFYKRLIN